MKQGKRNKQNIYTSEKNYNLHVMIIKQVGFRYKFLRNLPKTFRTTK